MSFIAVYVPPSILVVRSGLSFFGNVGARVSRLRRLPRVSPARPSDGVRQWGDDGDFRDARFARRRRAPTELEEKFFEWGKNPSEKVGLGHWKWLQDTVFAGAGMRYYFELVHDKNKQTKVVRKGATNAQHHNEFNQLWWTWVIWLRMFAFCIVLFCCIHCVLMFLLPFGALKNWVTVVVLIHIWFLAKECFLTKNDTMRHIQPSRCIVSPSVQVFRECTGRATLRGNLNSRGWVPIHQGNTLHVHSETRECDWTS